MPGVLISSARNRAEGAMAGAANCPWSTPSLSAKVAQSSFE